jgi:hypothetical protein
MAQTGPLRVLTPEELAHYAENQLDITADFLTRADWADMIGKDNIDPKTERIRVSIGVEHKFLDTSKNIDAAVKFFFACDNVFGSKEVANILVEYCPCMIAVTMQQKAEGNTAVPIEAV